MTATNSLWPPIATGVLIAVAEFFGSSAGCCAHKPVTAPATFSKKGKRDSKPNGKFTVVGQARLI
jgi:hypothetical protein